MCWSLRADVAPRLGSLLSAAAGEAGEEENWCQRLFRSQVSQKGPLSPSINATGSGRLNAAPDALGVPGAGTMLSSCSEGSEAARAGRDLLHKHPGRHGEGVLFSNWRFYNAEL